MANAREHAWIASLISEAAQHGWQQDGDPGVLPDGESTAVSLQRLWATAGRVEAGKVRAELWWLRFAEKIVATSNALPLIPAPILDGLDSSGLPDSPLPDSGRIRNAATQLLAGIHETLSVHAVGTHTLYGAIAQAYLHDLSRSPVTINRYQEAIAIAQSRTTLYGIAAGLTELYISSRVGGGHPPSSLAVRLHADLSRTIEATRAIFELRIPPPTRQSTAYAITRAARCATVAWNDLVIHAPSAVWTGEQDPRLWLQDAALLVRELAGLDATLEPAMRIAAADPAAPPQVRQLLRNVEADCRATQTLSLDIYTRDLDAPDLAGNSIQPPRRLRTADAPAALDRHIHYLASHPDALLLPDDLTQVAATAARLTAVVAQHTPVANQHAEHEAVRAWRRCHYLLHRIHRVHHLEHRSAGAGEIYRLSEWADRQLAMPRSTVGNPNAAHIAIAARLPELATIARTHLQTLQVTGALEIWTPSSLGPFLDPGQVDQTITFDTQVIYDNVPAGPELTKELDNRLAAAARTTEQLVGQPPHAQPVTTRTGDTPTTQATEPSGPAADSTGHTVDDDNLRRITDLHWIRWQTRTAILGPEPPDLPRSIESPTPTASASTTDLLHTVRTIGSDALAEAVRDDPAWPALQHAILDARNDGHDITTLLTETITQDDFSGHGLAGPATVLLGRIRRYQAPRPPGHTDPTTRGDRERQATRNFVRRVSKALTEPTTEPSTWFTRPGGDPRHPPAPPGLSRDSI